MSSSTQKRVYAKLPVCIVEDHNDVSVQTAVCCTVRVTVNATGIILLAAHSHSLVALSLLVLFPPKVGQRVVMLVVDV